MRKEASFRERKILVTKGRLFFYAGLKEADYLRPINYKDEDTDVCEW